MRDRSAELVSDDDQQESLPPSRVTARLGRRSHRRPISFHCRTSGGPPRDLPSARTIVLAGRLVDVHRVEPGRGPVGVNRMLRGAVGFYRGGFRFQRTVKYTPIDNNTATATSVRPAGVTHVVRAVESTRGSARTAAPPPPGSGGVKGIMSPPCLQAQDIGRAGHGSARERPHTARTTSTAI